MDTLPRVREGDEIGATEINALFRAAEGLGLAVEGDLEMVHTPGGWAVVDARPWSGWAKVTSGTNPYAWTEQIAASGGTFANGNRSGTTSVSPAYESTGNASVPANTVVLLRYEPTANAYFFTY